VSLYENYKNAVSDYSSPSMVVDLDQFDKNVERLISFAKTYNKKLRPATKSIRVPELIKRIIDKHPEVINGLMCFSIDEAKFLASEGLDNLLVAYPSCCEKSIKAAWELIKENKNIILMVDSIEHVQKIQKYKIEALKMPLCIDVDMSLRPFGGFFHIGVQRSQIRSIADFSLLANYILKENSVRLSGVMGYEAQVAGLGDKSPFFPFLNWAKFLIRKWSIREVKKFRQKLFNWCNEKRIDLDFFNGGGTGSIMYANNEPWLTEVTAGSGFLQSHLFDYYSEGHGDAALFFSLPVSRMPEKNIVTCKSGGFIASGQASGDKLPIPYLPSNLKTITAEGFGEVQTPFIIPDSVRLELGDPVFCRPSKAGEIAERFNTYLIYSKGCIVKEVKTYRGLGKSFF